MCLQVLCVKALSLRSQSDKAETALVKLFHDLMSHRFLKPSQVSVNYVPSMWTVHIPKLLVLVCIH